MRGDGAKIPGADAHRCDRGANGPPSPWKANSVRRHRRPHRPCKACPSEISKVMTMHQAVKNILTYADELAVRFEAV